MPTTSANRLGGETRTLFDSLHAYVRREDIPAARRGEGDILIGQANRVTAVVAQPFRGVGEPQPEPILARASQTGA